MATAPPAAPGKPRRYQDGGLVDSPPPRATWVGGVAPRAQLVSPPAVITGPATLPINEGLVTTFADPVDLQRYRSAKAAGQSEKQALLVGDNGIGHPDLGQVSTANSYGVAVPQDVLRQQLGNDPAAWRTARANLTVNNQNVMVPIVDIGPGQKPQARGVITDATYPLSQAMGIGGQGKAKLGLVPNAGPDYTTDPNAWYQEQGNIANRLGVPPIGASPAPTPPGAPGIAHFQHGGLVQRFQQGGPVIRRGAMEPIAVESVLDTSPPAPVPPAQLPPTAVGAALQTAGQYAGTRDVLTPQNAPSYGLDPATGFIARGTPSAPPVNLPPETTPPPGMAPGLGSTTGAPVSSPQEQPLPAPKPSFTPLKTDTPADQPDAKTPPFKPLDTDTPAEAPADKPEPFKSLDTDKPVEAPVEKPAVLQPGEPPQQPTSVQTPAQTPPAPESMEDAQKRYEAERARLGIDQPSQQLTKPIVAEMTPDQIARSKLTSGQLADLDAGKDVPEYDQALNDALNAPAQPPAQPASGTALKPESGVVGGNQIRGTSTIFGLTYNGGIDPDDNGKGIFGANTRNPGLKAVAVPVDVLTSTFGNFAKSDGKGGYTLSNTPEAQKVIQAIKSAHVELADAQGKMHSFPIVDIQGTLAGHPGKVLDMTYGAVKEMGFNDNHDVSYRIIGGDGKPYPIPASALAVGGKPSTPHRATVPSDKGQPVAQPGFSGNAPQLPERQVTGGGGAGGGGGFDLPSYGGSPGGTSVSLGNAIPIFQEGGGGGGTQTPATQALPPAEANPIAGMVRALVQRGFTPAQALDFAQSSQLVTPGKGLPPLTTGLVAAGGPPAAPSGLPPKLLPPPGAPGALGAPGAAVAASQAELSDALKALQSIGFKKGQAQSMLGKATGQTAGELLQSALKIHQQGKGGAVLGPRPTQPPTVPTQPPTAPGARPPLPTPVATTAPAAPSSRPAVAAPIAAPHVAPAGIRPPGSTIGVPNPSTISPDDPRVRKQADGKIKGEHFVPGDDEHERFLGGLPGGQGGRQRGILGAAEAAIAEKRPMHISYISAPKEAARYPTRESRTVQYEEHSPEARLMGTTEGQLVGHSFIPVAVGIKEPRKKGESHQGYIQGLSTNILANNFGHLNEKLTAMNRATPYSHLDHKFLNDMVGYLGNLNAGHTGTGRGYAVGTEQYPNDPDLSHTPHQLTRNQADFINTVINNTAAFAKHEDGQALRELARANGTLITPQGETNRMRHEITQRDPAWRDRVLEPSIRSFNTGLIHDVLPTEEHMPATIRPGQEFRDLTQAISRIAERGRPDVPISVSLHHNLEHNKSINQIERDFSEGRIDEHQARQALHGLGEDPNEYRFIGGSGGLLSPYEESPEAITSEEHGQLKDNLRKQWLGGKLGVDDYRKKVAEVPLPEIAARKPAPSPSEQESSPSQISQPSKLSGIIRPVAAGKAVGFGAAKTPVPTEDLDELGRVEAEPETAEEPPAAPGIRVPREISATSTTRFAPRGSSPETEEGQLSDALNKKLEKAYGSQAETFARLLSETGDKEQTHDAVDQLRSGKLDRHVALFHLAHRIMDGGEGALARHLEASGVTNKLRDEGVIDRAPKSDAEALAAWISHHGLVPRQKNGRPFSANPHRLLAILAGLSAKPEAAEEEQKAA